MTFQYSLRFESGERRGEVVPLTIVAAQGGTFTIGRKPGNSLQVTDVSISGRHAELAIDDDGVSLRDLNSTNGTQVAGRKVRRAFLEPGEEFTLGAVEFTLLDGVSGGVSGGGASGGSASGGSSSASVEPSAPAAEDSGFDELVLEEPDDEPSEVAPAASMPRKAPAKAPAKAPSKMPGRVPAAPSRQAAAVRTEGLGETQMMPQEDGLEITAEDLARSAKSSKLGPILLVGLAAVGGGAWWWLGQRAGGEDGDGAARQAAIEAPSSPPGNLLTAGYSFEQAEGWISAEDASPAFSATRSARRSGVKGLQADLVGGEVAMIASEVQRLPSGQRSFQALCHARADQGVELRLGLRYLTGTGEDATGVTVWSDPCAASDEFQGLSMAGTAPLGMSHIQVLLRAACTDDPLEVGTTDVEGEEALGDVKSVSIDDVELVPTAEAPASINLDPVTVTALGGASSSKVKAVALTSLERVLISSIRVAQRGAGEAAGLGNEDLVLAADAGGVSLTPAAGGTLVVHAESLVISGGIATISTGGYASHGSTFEREGVTGLILGDGARMVLISFASSAKVTARASGEGTTFRAEVVGGEPVTVKTTFMEERTLAQRLARRAKEQRAAGDSGSALATWDELLSTVPYDGKLIDEAAAAQSELLGIGRSELKALTEEVERARFFGLADLYREKLGRASELCHRYRGTDVEGKAVMLCKAIETELSSLDSSEEQNELTRLDGIGSVLRRSGAEDLAARLDAYRSSQEASLESSAAAGAATNPEGGQ